MNKLYNPTSFYRIQFHAGFTFSQAIEIVPYLKDMGISHVYTSPILAARPGSTHGYDIIDHQSLNPELGGREGFNALSSALLEAEMGLVMDIVPNHMGIHRNDNQWWLDVLEWGRSSNYAHYFDIDWFPETHGLHDQVLLPVLGDLYGTVLERDELRLRFAPETGSFSVWYHEHRFPLCPTTYHQILDHCLEHADPEMTSQPAINAAFVETKRLRFKPRSGTRRRALRSRGETFKKKLAHLVLDFPKLRQALEHAEHLFAPESADGRGLKRLHKLLEQQNFRLAYWRVAGYEINYRRFFQINDLAGLRVEEPEVFSEAHVLIHELVAENKVHGLRIDHIDGLYDPEGYLHTLQKLVIPHAEKLGFTPGRFPIYVEKILEEHESVRSDWPIHGTTGYDALCEINAVLVNADGLGALRKLFKAREGVESTDAHTEGVRAKRQVMDQELAAELEVLAGETTRLLKSDPATRDFSRGEVRQALREIVAHFPVYRTYIGTKGASTEDVRDLDWALGVARRARAVSHPFLFDVLESLLKATWHKRVDGRPRADVLRLARKFQQFTGPAMAKGMEDTTFYRVFPLASMNEVGMGPDRRISSVGDFHRQMVRRFAQWPDAMLTTATHDTKRSEDVRSRIAVLSEMPAAWAERVKRWQTLNRRARQNVNDVVSPCSRDEYLFYQTLVGVWPLSDTLRNLPDPAALDALSGRLQAYMVKAAREAKLNTSWLNPDEAYEKSLIDFVAQVLCHSPVSTPFLLDVQEIAQTMSAPGIYNSLTQLILRLTMPGVPDNYQGTELWDDSLVDPDNRREVDYAVRANNLREFKAALRDGELTRFVAELWQSWPDGRLKQFAMWRLLNLRRSHSELFLRGQYIPLEVDGADAEHVIAFARTLDHHALFVVLPRLSASRCQPEHGLPKALNGKDINVHLGPLAKDSKISTWCDILTGQNSLIQAKNVAGKTLFADLPVCIKIRAVQDGSISDMDCSS